MTLKPLEADELARELSSLPGWSGDQSGIDKKLTFRDFGGAMRFMQACIGGIDRRDHHPVWCNKYNSVEIHLDTFDAGHRVTLRDIDLAQFFETVLRESGEDFGLQPA